MSRLTITRGLPGAGKTTWAKSYRDHYGGVRVNRDDLRRMLFGTPDYSGRQERLVTEIQRAAIKTALKRWDVIADDTNLPPKRVREWFRFARANKAEFQVREFEVSVTDAIERQAGRPEGERVDPNVIYSMGRFLKNGQLQKPDLSIDTDDAVGEAYVPDETKPEAIIVDIDGTVALMQDRSPYDLSLVHTDLVNVPVVDLVLDLERQGCRVIFLSGREETSREVTEAWLDKNVLGFYEGLFMRPEGDRRKDAIVKRELFDEHVRHNYNVRFVLDDRQQVVDMWRELGLTCLQVAPGDF